MQFISDIGGQVVVLNEDNCACHLLHCLNIVIITFNVQFLSPNIFFPDDAQRDLPWTGTFLI